MKQTICCIIFLLFTCWANAEKPKAVTNEMLLEKNEMYQALNNKKFELVFGEIKNLRADMNKRFEQADRRIELMDKKFEKRFEQMERHLEKRFELIANEMKQLRKDANNRFDFNQQLIIFLLTMVVAVPVGIEIWRKIQDNNRIDPSEFDAITWIIAELSKCDERVRSIIKAAKEQKRFILPANLAYAV